MEKYEIKLATPNDNHDLLQMCRVPVRGSISLAFEREPDYFAAAQVQCNDAETYICREKASGRAIGMFGIGYRTLWKGTAITRHRYFCDLRIAQDASGSRLFLEMARYVRDHQKLENGPAQTIIFSDNRAMLNIVENSNERSRRLGIPYYHAVTDYTSNLIPYFKKGSSGKALLIRRAKPDDLPMLQAFHDKNAPLRPFYPVIKFDQLGLSPFYKDLRVHDFWLAFKGADLVGMTGVWDQKGFKQTRIVGYARSIALARPLANLLSPLIGTIPLPKPGNPMPYQSLTATLIKDDNPEVLGALVDEIRSHYSGSGRAYLLAGGISSDPLQAAFSRYPQKRTVHGRFFWVSAEDRLPDQYRDPLQYFDVARI